MISLEVKLPSSPFSLYPSGRLLMTSPVAVSQTSRWRVGWTSRQWGQTAPQGLDHRHKAQLKASKWWCTLEAHTGSSLIQDLHYWSRVHPQQVCRSCNTGRSSHAASQRDVNKALKWAKRNFLKLRKGKCKVWLLERTQKHQDMLRTTQLESTLAEKVFAPEWTQSWTQASYIQRR